MREIVLKSHGKINLGLDVLYKRDDGYHEINTIMQQIDLSDTLIIKENNKEDIVIKTDNKDLPLDSSNLIYKAWAKIKEKTGIKKGIEVVVEKNIPIAAGLAGGSSNAATVLKGLNELWQLGLAEEDLQKIGLEIGADVPFCITGGTALAEGIGEKLTKLKSFKDINLLLVNPGMQILTAEVYASLRPNGKRKMNIEKVIEFIENNDLYALAKSIVNVMEEVVIKKNPIILEIKEDLLDCGALCSLMSGSGPTVFGLFDDLEKLNFCKGKLTNKYSNGKVFIVKTI